jgi:hypothetical protein
LALLEERVRRTEGPENAVGEQEPAEKDELRHDFETLRS